MNNNIKIEKNTWALLIAAFVLLIMALLVNILIPAKNAHANPSSFLRSSTSTTNNTVTATSTPTAALNGGTGTSTIVLNGTLGSGFAPNTVSLALFRVASSGRQINKIDIQYSNNCDSTSPDWYSTHGSSTAAVTGTIVWPFASTTQPTGGAAADMDNTMIQLGNVPEKCVRALITVPVGTVGSSSIWGMLVAKKEVQ
jgi:hypothetical protein